MASIDELIEYHNENEYLDFKQEEYKEHKKHELVKDVLAFANAEYNGDRYIIIGVKKTNDELEIYSIENPLDSSDIQTYILEYIKPDLKIDYFSHQYQADNLMVLRINNPVHQPYAMKKTLSYFNGTKTYPAESMKIRKGSRTFDMTLEDLNKIYSRKHTSIYPFEDKITVTFKDSQQSLLLTSTSHLNPPSSIKAQMLRKKITEQETLLAANPKAYSDQIGRQMYPNDSLEGWSIPELKEALKNVKARSIEKDNYFYAELSSHKLQFYIQNNSTQPLKNVVMEIVIPNIFGVNVAEKIPHDPRKTYGVASAEMIRYPAVKTDGQHIKITDTVGDVQHRLEAELLYSPLRVWFDQELAGQCLDISVILHAENLPEPLNFNLTIEVSQ